MNATIAAKLAANSTDALIGALVIIDTVNPATMTNEERMVKAWTCDEVERRIPSLTPVLTAYADSIDDDRTYVRVILDAIAAA